MKTLGVLVLYPLTVGIVGFELAYMMATGHPWPWRAKEPDAPMVIPTGKWLVSRATKQPKHRHLPKEGSDTTSLCGLTFLRPADKHDWRDITPPMCVMCTGMEKKAAQ